jgi:hypothetical protein
MNKLALKVVSLFVVIIYSILVLYWVINDEGFYGVRFLSIWSIVMMWVITLWFIYLNYEFKHKPEESLKNDKNIKLKLFLGAFLLIPMVSELPDKVAILFYNVNADISKMKEFVVEVNGYRKTGTSRQGGKFWAVVKTENSGYRMICNLIVLADCEYGKYKGEVFKAKVVIGDRYPIENYMIIYEMMRSDGSKLVDYNDQVKLYERNRSYISYFLFLIYLPSMFFALVVPRVFK